MIHSQRIRFVGLDFDPLSLNEVLDDFQRRSAKSTFDYLVTPNVDHIVRLHDVKEPGIEGIWDAYRQAKWCVCDSRILSAFARHYGLELPVATGSDITAAVLAKVCRAGDKIAIVGGSDFTVARVRKLYPHLLLVHHSPPMGMRYAPAAVQAAADFAITARARFIFLAVGSPQQELIAQAIAHRSGATGTALCIGASIEFVVGAKQRAPKLIQQLRLEWAFRLLADPVRLWRRYLISGPRIFRIVHKTQLKKKS